MTALSWQSCSHRPVLAFPSRLPPVRASGLCQLCSVPTERHTSRRRQTGRLRATASDTKSSSDTSKDSPKEVESEPASRPSTSSQQQENAAVDLSSQLRRLRSEKQPAQADNFFQGIFEEIQLIEWPKALQAVQDTFLVIAILAGTTVFLFGANSVLADASARFLRR